MTRNEVEDDQELSTVFFFFEDRRDIILVDILPKREVINFKKYSKTFNGLKRVIQNKRREKLTEGELYMLLHDLILPGSQRRFLSRLVGILSGVDRLVYKISKWFDVCNLFSCSQFKEFFF